MNKSSKNQKSKQYIENFCNFNPNDLKTKLKEYFTDLKVYVEIFNGSVNITDSFSSKLREYNANINNS